MTWHRFWTAIVRWFHHHRHHHHHRRHPHRLRRITVRFVAD
jgi:hypothetical protein